MTPAKPFPTFLNKTGAMIFAAEQLITMADQIASVQAAFNEAKRRNLHVMPGFEKVFDDIKVVLSGVVDIDLQVNALKDAATEIRTIATETKLAEARAAQVDFRDRLKR